MWQKRIFLIHRIATIPLQLRSTSKIAVELSPEIQRQLENDELKPRHHPGRNKPGKIEIPPEIIKGLRCAIGDYPIKTLHRQADELNKYLVTRHPPPEQAQVEEKLTRIQEELQNDKSSLEICETDLSETELEKLRMKQTRKIQKRMKERLYPWRPMSYGHYESLLYALVRGSMEYTILVNICKEIVMRDPDYKPRSYFDFGAGIGTGMWAASNFWKQTIYEYFNVDSSRDMNELSDLILRGGYENKESMLKNVFYRQFLPSTETKYDLIVSSFSLFELPNAKTRKEVILNLWKKCDGYLIIVEYGTRVGFELVNEARQIVLGQKDPALKGHIFSPCPHDFACPRKSNPSDRTPCNFEVQYETVPIGQLASKKNALYSYIVLKKGARNAEDESNEWPRIVRETLTRTKHSICRLCTREGKLQEIIFTESKHGKLAYRCAKSSKWGDRLPIIVGDEIVSDKAIPMTKQKNDDEQGEVVQADVKRNDSITDH